MLWKYLHRMQRAAERQNCDSELGDITLIHCIHQFVSTRSYKTLKEWSKLL